MIWSRISIRISMICSCKLPNMCSVFVIYSFAFMAFELWIVRYQVSAKLVTISTLIVTNLHVTFLLKRPKGLVSLRERLHPRTPSTGGWHQHWP